jgi:predicted branched-subunit amino acid permease
MMQGLGLIMAAIFLIVVFGPYRRMRRAVSTARAAEAIETIRKLIVANVVLGAATIVIAAVH